MSEALQKIGELKAKQEALKAEIKTSAEATVRQAIKEFLAETPQIGSIRWTQYTPYFNDGEPCIFGVNEFEFSGPGEDEPLRLYNAHRWNHEKKQLEPNPDVSADLIALAEKCRAFEKALANKEILLAAFGDHAEVVANRERIEVTEYNHD